jgi:hypothetical protein
VTLVRFRLRALAALGAFGVINAGLLGAVPAQASAGPGAAASTAVPGPVVLLGTGGLSWSDVDSSAPALNNLLDDDSSGWLADRSVRSLTCPADGWLAVSAGKRAADIPVGPSAGQKEASCREPQLQISTDGGPATVPEWPTYLKQAASDTYEAHPGLLATTLARADKSSAAVGPGAAIALADAQGRVSRAWPGRVDGSNGVQDPKLVADDVKNALATNPELLVVDLGPIRDPAQRVSGEPKLTGAFARPRATQVQLLDTRLGLVLDELPADATVIVASLADSGTPSVLQLLAARGPVPGGGSYLHSLLGSNSTRQDSLAQTTDLLPTVLTALGVPVPDDAVGAVVKPVQTDASLEDRLRKLDDVGEAANAVHPIAPWFFSGLEIAQLLLYGVATLVLRRRSKKSNSPAAALDRRRTTRWLRWGAVVFASVPAATFLANLLPWWRAGIPGLAITGAVIVFVIPISALALLGPWRKALLGPMGAVAAVTAAVLAVDVTTGSHLVLSSLMGMNPVVAGRFYGFGNPAFAVFVTGALLTAIALADWQVRLGNPRRGALIVAAIGLVATICDGAPGFGSDFGGPPAIIPAFAVLALLVAGVKVSWRRAVLIAGVTLTVIVLLSALDWLRGPGERTHLGRFVQTVIDGGAWPVVRRKAGQNIKILFTSWLTALLPIAVAFVVLVLARPVAVGVRPLQLAYDRSPVLRHGVVAFGVLMLLAAGLNDSGLAIPAVGAMVAIPLLIAASVRALELEDVERLEAAIAAARKPRVGKPKQRRR